MAIQTIPSTLIADNAISAAKIASGIISADDIADNSLTAAKISASTSPTFGGLTVNTDANSTLTIADGGADAITLYGGSGDELYIGANAAYKLRFKTDGNIVMDNGGNLGIGTDSPGVPLHVKTDTEHQIKIESTASAGASMQLYSGGSYAYTVYEHPTANFRIGAYGGSSFIIRDQGNSADRLVIDSSGNIGIGTDSPNSRLHVVHPVSEFTTSLSETTTKSTLQLKTHAEDSTITTFGGVSGGAAYIQRSNGAGTTPYDLLLNPYGGNVGIGTDSASYKLDVTGSGSAGLRLNGTGTGGSWMAFSNSGTIYGYISSAYHVFTGGSVSDFGIRGENNLVFGSSTTERMRIHSSGDISIGSSGTIYKNISAAQSPTLSIDGTFPAINLKDDSGTAAFYGINGSRLYLGGNTSTVDLLFYLNDAAVTKITDVGIVSTNCSTNYKGVHIHGSQAPCITFAKNTTDETSPEWRIGVSGYDGSDLAISVGSTTGDRVRIDPNGRLLAGVENVAPRAGNTNVGNEAIQSYGPIISGAFQGSYTGGLHCIRDWFVYAGPSTNTGPYLHIKTDLANSTANSAYTMSFFKYRAYCYGGGGNVAEGLLGWHNWSGGYYNVGVLNYNSSWALVQSSYTSSDNYVVLVAYLPASYCHLAIDWDQWGGYAFRTAKVIATTQTSSSTGAY